MQMKSNCNQESDIHSWIFHVYSDIKIVLNTIIWNTMKENAYYNITSLKFPPKMSLTHIIGLLSISTHKEDRWTRKQENKHCQNLLKILKMCLSDKALSKFAKTVSNVIQCKIISKTDYREIKQKTYFTIIITIKHKRRAKQRILLHSRSFRGKSQRVKLKRTETDRHHFKQSKTACHWYNSHANRQMEMLA